MKEAWNTFWKLVVQACGAVSHAVGGIEALCKYAEAEAVALEMQGRLENKAHLMQLEAALNIKAD
jgi:hypothetical protein